MKQIFIIFSSLVLILSAPGCAHRSEQFQEIDQDTREAVLAFLQQAALGGRGKCKIITDAEVGESSVGNISGSVEGSFSKAEIVSISFLDDKLIEVSRTEVLPDGKWGPLTMLYGPKALLLVEGKELLGYSLYDARYAAVLSAASAYADFRIDPMDTGIVALALIYSGKGQEAANLLAQLQTIHPTYSGLPANGDVFGVTFDPAVDYCGTAWTGYAAAVLAEASDHPDLWREAKAYASYLEDLSVPAAAETRLGGWLLFSKLSKEYPDYAALADMWQLEPGEEYNPLLGIYMLMSGVKEGEIKKYADKEYVPVSERDKWIHYSLLAALDYLPAQVDVAVESVPGGMAVFEEGKISLQATGWMMIALQGGLKK
ncbi:MAG: hypothetical protein ACOX21_01210 [Bacillota bacterium]|nr:hypothetical protein [Bacillota bacterium]